MTQNSLVNPSFTPEKIALIKRTIANGASDDELALFINQCQRTGLDPFSRQIYSIQRQVYDPNLNRKVTKMVTQVSIDGLRLIAERSGVYAGQVGPFWRAIDGDWVEVWTSKDYPFAAKVGVVRRDFSEPLFAVALWSEYCPMYDGKVGAMWAKYPTLMLAKSAEALALRRAFPQELACISNPEEDEPQPDPEMVANTYPNKNAEWVRPMKLAENLAPVDISIPEWMNDAMASASVKANAFPKVESDAVVIDAEYTPVKGSSPEPAQTVNDTADERPFHPLRLQSLIAEVASRSTPASDRLTEQVISILLALVPDGREFGDVCHFLLGVRDPHRASPKAVHSVYRWLKPDDAGKPSSLALEELAGVRLHLLSKYQ